MTPSSGERQRTSSPQKPSRRPRTLKVSMALQTVGVSIWRRASSWAVDWVCERFIVVFLRFSGLLPAFPARDFAAGFMVQVFLRPVKTASKLPGMPDPYREQYLSI